MTWIRGATSWDRVPFPFDKEIPTTGPVWTDGTFIAWQEGTNWIISDSLVGSFWVTASNYSTISVNTEFRPEFSTTQWENGFFSPRYCSWGWNNYSMIHHPFFHRVCIYDGDWNIFVVTSSDNNHLIATANPNYVFPEDLDDFIKMEYRHKRWINANGFLGEYLPVDGAEGVKSIGLPQWSDGTHTWTRSFKKKDGKWGYGDIHFDRNAGKWILGEYNSEAGWYEGAEPSKTETVVFEKHMPSGISFEPESVPVPFEKYVMGDNTEKVYLGEVSIIR